MYIVYKYFEKCSNFKIIKIYILSLFDKSSVFLYLTQSTNGGLFQVVKISKLG